MIGPWAHLYPHEGYPGPAIGFLQECLRWWDDWLKGAQTGIMDEPRLRAWMPGTAGREGRWLAEESLASERMRTEIYILGRGSLAKMATESPPLRFRGVEACGLEAGRWLVFGSPTDFPPDQRAEDGLSLTFDSDQLERPLEILGFPRLTLTCSADQQVGLVAARLCDVEPNGRSALVTRGLLNLAHRDDHEHPAALEPGSEYPISVTMSASPTGSKPVTGFA